MKRILIADERHKDAIAELIVSAYQTSLDFQLVNASYLRSECLTSDRDSCALIACDGERVLSAMHGKLCSDVNDVVRALTHIKDPSVVPLPAFALYRAATVPEMRRSALNSLLRLHFLRIAISKQAKYMVGSIYQGADRTGTMNAMGYRFSSGHFRTDVLADRKSHACLALLNLITDADRAEQYLMEITTGLRTLFPFQLD